MRLAVFSYNFPHKKTQDFLFRLFLEKVEVGIVLAADPVELGIPSPSVRMKVRGGGGLVHPRLVAERFGWRFEVVEHNAGRTRDLLREERVDAGVISGARILKPEVIESVPRGIINFHPGLLPEGRGLDAMQWAIYEDRPIGVTAHLIDGRVDAGLVLLKRELPILEDDTVFDLSQRLMDVQTDMLPEAIAVLARGAAGLESVGSSPLHRKMPPELEAQVAGRLKAQQARAKTRKA